MPTILPCLVWVTLLFQEYLLPFCFVLTTGAFHQQTICRWQNVISSFLSMNQSSLKRKTNFYFNATFFAYFMGLVATILVMHLYRHAQPALLYLVPACLGTPLFLALVRGDIKTLFK